jgi:hypothetical protein
MDKREAILARLAEVAVMVPSVSTVARNQDELSEHKRPAIVIFDADEAADERAEQQGHSGRAPNIVEMTPEVMILLGAVPEQVGSALNELRAALVKAVLTDDQLIALAGSNGRVRYAGCTTHLGHGRSMEASMGVHFVFSYVLRPALTFLKEARNARLSLDRQLLRRQRQNQLQGGR